MKLFLRCLGECRPEWRMWLALMALATLMPPLGAGMPLVEKQLIDGVVLGRQLELLPVTLGLYCGLWLAAALAQLAAAIIRTYVGERLMLRLRQRLFAQAEALSVSFAQRAHSGQTMALFANDVPAFAGLFTTAVVGLLGSVVAIVVGGVVMFSLSWQLALVAAVLPLLVAAVAASVTRPLRPIARRVQIKAAELTERFQESLAGLREIVAFGQGASQAARLATTLDELLRLRMRVAFIDTTLSTGHTVFSLAVTLTILGFGGYLVVQEQTTLGTVVAMRGLFDLVFVPAGQVIALFGSIQKSLAGADRVYGFLDQAPQVRNRLDARVPRRLLGQVTFDQVTFAYQLGRPVLQQVSFDARPGEVIALVGPSGGGKSTLVSLIARFHDPLEGQVRLDGADLRELSLDAVRRHIAMVFQDPFLFATSIRENIAFGRPGAHEPEIIIAARAANAWEFIERLPSGLDTHVGERGVQLSEGQKQRVALARAFLREPRILILDEPTSALDARSEHLIQAALEELMRGRTTFVIAHRLATIERADRILVIDRGSVVESGSHGDLLEAHGLYRELFDLQFGTAPFAMAGAT